MCSNRAEFWRNHFESCNCQDDDRLDRTVIGDYLGDPDDVNRAVMYQYVDLLDFTGKDLVQSLR